ncbi:MAG: c-type cytochrome [Verrucomicrobiaceae bacterium]|nr:c-type cytochrome [Verrucomicrobiaceae bacterium]
MPDSHPSSGPQLREHVYDGIQEYDQKLPNWWLFTWYITMVFFVFAWLSYYQFGIGDSDIESVEKDLAVVMAARDKELGAIDDDKLWAMSKDPAIIASGKATYDTTCIACHAPDMSAHIAGAKLPGLPLNDTEWKHGSKPTQLLSIVRKGAPDLTKGMPPWEPQLGIKRVIEVVAFILSKHDKDKPTTLAADSPLKAGASATPAPAGTAPAAPAAAK